MANFNTTNRTNQMTGTNHEGAKVHSLSAIETLFSKALGTFFGEKTFYEKRTPETAAKELEQLISNISEKDKEYALKIASLARSQGMIEYPIQILASCFKDSAFKGDALAKSGISMKDYTFDIVRRASDINSILATHLATGGTAGSLPAQMRKCLRTRVEAFDKFKLSKGLERSSSVTLADAIKMLHPVPKNKDMESFYKEILEGGGSMSSSKAQIQQVLSAKGDTEELAESIENSSLLALMKNLSNLLDRNVLDKKEVCDSVIAKLTDVDNIRKSKVLPIRFYQAHQIVSQKSGVAAKRIAEALEDGLDASIEATDFIEGYNCYLVDTSGSMVCANISQKSVTSLAEVAVLLGAIAYKRGYGDLFAFNSTCHKIEVSRKSSVFDIMREVKRTTWNGGTNLIFALSTIEQFANKNGVSYDNLILVSDNDCYTYDDRLKKIIFGEGASRYASRGVETDSDQAVNRLMAKGTLKKIWLNNLAGNDFAVVNTNSSKKNLITGYSERFVNMVNLYNANEKATIKDIIDLLLAQEKGA